MKFYSEDFILKNKDLFYLLPNGTYFPHLKEDIVLAIDNNIPFTYIPILESMDIPYIPREWNNLIYKHGDEPIIGKYVAKMKLAAYKNMRYADSEKACKVELTTIIWNEDPTLPKITITNPNIAIQGTSSTSYPVKNYKVEFPF